MERHSRSALKAYRNRLSKMSVKRSSTHYELHLGTKSNHGKTAHKMLLLPAAAVVVALSSLMSISDFDLHAILLLDCTGHTSNLKQTPFLGTRPNAGNGNAIDFNRLVAKQFFRLLSDSFPHSEYLPSVFYKHYFKFVIFFHI